MLRTKTARVPRVVCKLYVFIQGGQLHYVSQFQVLGWTSDGKASSPAGIVSCMLHIENVQRTSGDGPIVVHCRLVMSFA